MQISSAFGTVSDSFSWFINSYGSLGRMARYREPVA
jgi:ABC-type uncharacterized transport system, permease and ATPase components